MKSLLTNAHISHEQIYKELHGHYKPTLENEILGKTTHTENIIDKSSEDSSSTPLADEEEISEKIIERFIRRSRLTKHEKWKERAIIKAEKGIKIINS